MSLFHCFTRPGLEEGLERFHSTDGAILLDVRTREEYAGGHVPGSRNIPLDRLSTAKLEKGRPIFAYCHSGARSAQACAQLAEQGYEAVNLGGVDGYRGTLEQGEKE